MAEAHDTYKSISQEQIDCLDYLIYTLKNKSKRREQR